MADTVLREATEAEAETLNAVIRAAFEEYRGRLDPPSGAHAETADGVRRRLATARAVLALRDGMVIGCVFWEPAASHLYCSRLAVLPAHRGRGVGWLLMDHVEARARELERARVRLGVRRALPGLRAAYERRGYRGVEHGTHAGFTEPTYVILEKELAGPGPGLNAAAPGAPEGAARPTE